MKEKIVHERKFKRVTDKGLETATAKLCSMAGQKPYFSVTNDNGASHEEISRAFPELETVVKLHLCDEDGRTMHAEANGLYWLGNSDFDRIAGHFRIPNKEAEWLWSEFMLVSKKAEMEAREKSSSLWDGFQKKVEESVAKPVSALKGGKDYPSLERNLRAVSGKKKDVESLIFFCEGEPSLKAVKEILKRILDGARLAATLTLPKGSSLTDMEYLARDLRDYSEDLSHAMRRSEEPFIRQTEVELKSEKERKWIHELIESCFASCWKRQAEEAIEILKEPDLIDVPDYYGEEDTMLLKVGGETIPVTDASQREPQEVTSGGYTYAIFRSSEEAGKAAEAYWRDMAKNDKEEFRFIVGEENLLAWALGEKAGPGAARVTSLEEWFALWKKAPEEQWAIHDGEERHGFINAALSEELGWSFEDEDGQGWMPVVLYRR